MEGLGKNEAEKMRFSTYYYGPAVINEQVEMDRLSINFSGWRGSGVPASGRGVKQKANKKGFRGNGARVWMIRFM